MLPSITSGRVAKAAVIGSSTARYPGLERWFDRIIDVCLHGLVFFLPLFFSSWTLDAVELNKQALLMLMAAVAGIAWLGKALLAKQFSLGRSWLHGVVALFGVGYVVVSLTSQDRYQSVVGLLGQMGWSLATVVSLILLYFVAVNHLRRTEQVHNLLFTFFASSLLLAVISIMQVMGVFIFPGDITKSTAFTPLGSVFALATYLAVPLVMGASLSLHGCRNQVCYLGSLKPIGLAARLLVWLMLVACVVFLMMVDFWVAWVAVLFGMVLVFGLGFLRTRTLGRLQSLVVPMVLAVLAIVFLFMKTPFTVQIAAEVSPSASASWEIARAVLQEKPLFGTGPGTWMADYALYRSPGVNQSQFWSVRFDRGFSAFLTMLATMGIVGTSLWLILLASVIGKSSVHLMQERNEDVWFAYLTLFCGWAVGAGTAFLYSVNMGHQFVFWFLLALLGALITKNDYHWNAKHHASIFGLLSMVFVGGLVGCISIGWLNGQRYAAELAFTRGVGAYRSSRPIKEAIGPLQEAVRLNGTNDLYVRNLSQAYLVQVLQSMQQKPTPEKFAEIQNKQIQPALEAAMKATELAPHTVDNWSNAGLFYHSMASFLAQADDLALAEYQKALELEPLNPAYYTELARIYLAKADAKRPLLAVKDPEQSAQAKQQVDESLKMAEGNARKAIKLKPDYFPAHYHLGIVLERQGKLKEAITELEQVLTANNKEMGVAFELSILYYRDTQTERARDLLEQIVRLDPNQVNARWYLASIYEESKRYAEAIQQLEALTQLVPTNQAVEQRLAEVRKKTGKVTKGLPEPLPEAVNSPREQNPIITP